MKTCREKAFIITVSLMILITLGSCGQGKYVEKSNEELYGTWTNESYKGISLGSYYKPQKVVITPGTYSDYQVLTDTNQAASGKEEVTSKWKDSEGNIWYKVRGSGSVGSYHFKFQSLHKLSKSATVRELVSILVDEYGPNSYPTKIDSQDNSYRIYYRAK
jgi:hypothetical protein